MSYQFLVNNCQIYMLKFLIIYIATGKHEESELLAQRWNGRHYEVGGNNQPKETSFIPVLATAARVPQREEECEGSLGHLRAFPPSLTRDL